MISPRMHSMVSHPSGKKEDPLLQLIRLGGSERAFAVQLNSLRRSPSELNMLQFTSIHSILYASLQSFSGKELISLGWQVNTPIEGTALLS
ncbi:hypothetical protein TNCT_49071 [Trichonephila clavata]|uniref:Uncharacterized protein n=1 Tax=Trichonephila clavata TaxID=2740835 RepID=A0A8X6L6U8_TRICU|nr:hypothetical protein TNCT_49071 [Trichonephila clavata]